jgi:hypothetical protein
MGGDNIDHVHGVAAKGWRPTYWRNRFRGRPCRLSTPDASMDEVYRVEGPAWAGLDAAGIDNFDNLGGVSLTSAEALGCWSSR